MADRLTAAAVRSHAKDLRSRLDDVSLKPASVRTVEKNAENRPKSPKSRALVCEAMRRAGLDKTAFAIDAKQSEGVISEALNGVGPRNLALEWVLDQTSDAFVLAFIDLLLESRNLTRESKRETRKALCATLLQAIFDLDKEDA